MKASTKILMALLVLTGCGRPESPNIILIGVDTLRADHLGCYGYPRDTSPTVDRLAAQGIKFDLCLTPTPRTTQSICSIMTGKYPMNHGVRFLYDKLPEGEVTLAEKLKATGYTTISVVATGVPYQAVDQGFDIIKDTEGEFDARETTDRAIDALRQVEGKYFLWVFYRDPHMDYAPPEILYDREYRGNFREAYRYRPSKGESVYKNSLSEGERKHAIALYDSEIRYTDDEIGRLLEYIEDGDDNNIIIFCSDHGEGLGEHNYYYDHGDLLDQPSLHVPLIIKGMEFPQKTFAGPVRLIDIMPTLLKEVGLSVPETGIDGADLKEVVGAGKTDLPAFSETGHVLLNEAYELGFREVPGIEGRIRGLISGRYKIIYFPRKDGVAYEVYDLVADPGENENIADRIDPELLRGLKDRIDGLIARDEMEVQRPEVTKRELDRLRSLGYL